MNPFLINNYIGPDYFCDRENEAQTLINNVVNGNNTAFFAQRKIGKTALIRHVFFLLVKRNIPTIYLDIYSTQNLKEFTNQMANAIYKSFPPKKNIGMKFMETIKLLRPVFTMDVITGSPELSLDITHIGQFEKTIPQLLQFLDEQNLKITIAIDEFQQILAYPEKNVEAILRTVIQQLKNVCFIFCGSNQKMIHQIFNSAKRPFYASTNPVNLQKINPEIYDSFIKKMFVKNKFFIHDDATELILDLTFCHTYYTQRLCYEIYTLGDRNVTKEVVLQALGKILTENEGVYFQYRSLLTVSQWKLLKAIAFEEKVEQLYGQKFINYHKLGASANVQRAISSLLEKEMVFYNDSVELPYYEVQDKFLMRWLKNK